MSFDRLVVIGAGAVGGVVGGLVMQSDFSVEFVARGEHGHTIRNHGLTVRMPHRQFTIHPPCFQSLDEVNWRPNDLILLSTKLQDAKSVLVQMGRIGLREIPVACACNGMHAEQWARPRFDTVLSMLVWMPASFLKPGEVTVYAAECPGVLDVGPAHKDCPREWKLAESWSLRLNRAGFDSVARHDIQRWKLAKWITNLGNTAQALVTDDWQSVAQAARCEGEAVLDAANVDRVSTEELLQRCREVKMLPVDGQARQGGSTWQSQQRGQPLESRWIKGAMANLGRRVGVPTPVNQKLARAAIDALPMPARQFLE